MKKKEKRNILLVGYHGLRNAGADARLMINEADIKKALPDYDITIFGFDDYIRHYVQSNELIAPKLNIVEGYLEIYRSIKKHDIIIIDEGIPFADYWGKGFLDFWLYCLKTAKKHGKTTVLYGIDIDRLELRDRMRVISVINNYVDLAITRTKDSYRKLCKLGIDEHRIAKGEEITYLLKPDKMKNRLFSDNRLVFGVSLKNMFGFPIEFRPWGRADDLYHYPFYFTYKHDPRRERYHRFNDHLADLLRCLIRKYDANIAVFEMECPMDDSVCQEVIRKIGCPGRVRLFASRDYWPTQMKALIAKTDLFIGTRLHSLIFAFEAGIPLISIGNDMRFVEFHDEIDHADFMLDYKDKHLFERIRRRVPILLGHRQKINKRFKSVLSSLVAKAQDNHKVLKRFVENVEPDRKTAARPK